MWRTVVFASTQNLTDFLNHNKIEDWQVLGRAGDHLEVTFLDMNNVWDELVTHGLTQEETEELLSLQANHPDFSIEKMADLIGRPYRVVKNHMLVASIRL